MINQKLCKNQTVIIEMISNGEPLMKILSFIVESIEKNINAVQSYGAVMLYNSTTKKLDKSVSVSLPPLFINTLVPSDVGPYEETCGTAAFFKHPIIVTDAQNDILWSSHRNVACDFGFRTSWATPIMSATKELLGTITLYYKDVYKPDANMIKIIDAYNRLAAIAIERTEVAV